MKHEKVTVTPVQGGDPAAAPGSPSPDPRAGSSGGSFLAGPDVSRGGGTVAACDTVFSDGYPAIAEYLFALFQGSEERQTSTLLIFGEEGKVKLCLSDRDRGRVLFRSGDTLQEALESLESALETRRADWRTTNAQRKRG